MESENIHLNEQQCCTLEATIWKTEIRANEQEVRKAVPQV